MDTRRPQYTPEHVGHVTESVYASRGISFFRRISWGAIFAGTLVSIVAMLLLNLLGIGIGLGSINPVEEANPFAGIGTGAIIWWVVSNLIAIFAGGYVAGRMAGVPLKTFSTLHGILTWCLYTLVSFWLLTTAIGGILSGVGTIMQKAISAAGSGIQAVADNNGQNQNNQQASINFYEIKREVQQVLGDTGDPALGLDSLQQAANNVAQETRQNLRNESYVSDDDINAIIQNVLYEGDKLVDKVDRQDVVNVVTARTNLSETEVNNIAEVVVRQHEQARQELSQLKTDALEAAETKGQKVADSASTAAIWSFVALFLGAVVGGVGGRAGKPDEIEPVEAEHDVTR